MTTLELIAKLRAADPSGLMQVLVEHPGGNYTMHDPVVLEVAEDGEESPGGEPVVLISPIA